MAQAAFERMENDMEDMGDQAGGNASCKILNMIGIARGNKQGLYRLAMVALGLLCIILLMVIVFRQTHGSPAETTADGKFQPQTCDNLSLHQLLLQKANLEDRYNKLDSENRQLQISYSNLTSSKSELQSRNSVLTGEIAELQKRYNNLTRETDDLLKRNTKLDSRMAAGWLLTNSSLYKINTAKKSWHASRESCLEMGADLVVVNNIDEQEFLLPYKRHWIGLSDTDTEGDWTWVDGSALTTSFWRPFEPNNANNEDCAEISMEAPGYSQGWNDVRCSEERSYICEDHV